MLRYGIGTLEVRACSRLTVLGSLQSKILSTHFVLGLMVHVVIPNPAAITAPMPMLGYRPSPQSEKEKS